MSGPASRPNRLSAWGQARFFHLRRCDKGLQRLARHRVDDPAFNWRAFARFVANDMLFLKPGRYFLHGWPHAVSWPVPTASTVLCFGVERVFETPDDVPAHIWSEVEAGVADAVATGKHIKPDKQERADALLVSAGEKLRLELYFGMGQIDCDQKEWEALLRNRRNDRRRERRAEIGKTRTPRTESAAAQARAAGIKPDTLRAQVRRAKRKAEANVANLAHLRELRSYADQKRDSENGAIPDSAPLPSGGAAHDLVDGDVGATHDAFRRTAPLPGGIIMNTSPADRFLELAAERGFDPTDWRLEAAARDLNDLLDGCPDHVRDRAMNPASLAVRAHHALGREPSRELAIEAMAA